MKKTKERKKIQTIPETVLSRQWSIAKLSLRAGSRFISRRISENFSSESKSAGESAIDVFSDQVHDWVSELGRLKGSMQKAGQMLSMYGEYFLRPEINAVLRELQADSPSVEWPQIERQLIRSLGKEKLELLEIEEEPSGSASIGQVHKAVIKATGETIALKIQYPGVAKATESDLASLRRLLNFANIGFKAKDMDVIFEEVRRMLNQEMNYEKELEFTQKFYDRLEGLSEYIVPKPYPEFSTKKVLATAWINAQSFSSEEFSAISQERKNRIGALFLDLYFREIFEWGEIQTDPHLGNYQIQLSEDGHDRLVCFDYGATRVVEPSFLVPYRAMLRAALANDPKTFLLRAEELEFLEPDDPDSLYLLFWDTCRMIVEPFLPEAEWSTDAKRFFTEDGHYDFGASNLPDRLIVQARNLIKGFWNRTPPEQIIFMDRKLGGTYLFLKSIGASLPGCEIINPYLAEKH